MAEVIRMEGAQALSFVSIHPVKCGLYFRKVQQLEAWAKYWDALQSVTNDGNNRICYMGCITSLSDCSEFMESLMAHIFDGGRKLELVVDSNKFVIKKLYGDEGGFVMAYYHYSGHSWINQCSYGYIFKGMKLFEFLEILHGQMYSDNWGYMPSCYINY